MVNDSNLWMIPVNLLIVVCLTYLFFLWFKRRYEVVRLGLTAGTAMVLLGLTTISFAFLRDFGSIVLDVLSGIEADTNGQLEKIYSISPWYSVFIGVAAIGIGMAYWLRIIVPNVMKMESMVDTGTEDLSDTNIILKKVLEAQREMQEALIQSEQRFRELVELLPQTVFEVSAKGDLIFVNRAGYEMFQLSPEDVEDGVNIREYCVAEDRERLTNNFKAILNGQFIGPNEYTYRRSDHSTLPVIISTRPIIRDGGMAGAIGVIFDITRRKRIEQELEASRTMLRTVLDTIPVRVFWKDTESIFLGCNKEFAKDANFASPSELIGKSDFDIADHAKAKRYRADDESIIRSGTAKINYEETRVMRDGSQRWLKISKIPLLGSDKGIIGILGCYEDITNTRRLSQQLEHLANHDSLTGLVNRHAFEQRVSRVVESTRVDDSKHALCYLDLDQFKVVNDTCGHAAGDELLNQLGTLLQQQVRHRDTLARLGGDEFAVLMEHCSMQQASRVAEALRQLIAEFWFTWEGRSFSIGASIGVVPITKETSSVTELLMKADSACYSAKEGGRNRVHIYREDDLDILQRQGEVQWISRLTEALEQNRFVLYGQPIVALDGMDNGLKHYEILIRMVGEDGQLILPGAFFPAVERYNISARLDRWVIEQTFTWLLGSPGRLENLGLCSINLSGHSLSDEEFQLFVEEQLQKRKIPPSKICFEITETAAISNLSRAVRFIARMKDKGCRFALDDFGSGLSSFAYLKNLPVDYLKIDGMFVMDILDDPIDLAMVRSINEIGQLMGKKTIAEFVENEQIGDMLKEIGVNYMQGFAAGPPRPIDQIG